MRIGDITDFSHDIVSFRLVYYEHCNLERKRRKDIRNGMRKWQVSSFIRMKGMPVQRVVVISDINFLFDLRSLLQVGEKIQLNLRAFISPTCVIYCL